MAKQKYWNGTSWEVVGTDASKVALLDAAGKFVATELEAAMLELFTFANNGKTSIATAVNNKGVPATSADTFPTLATKIGQIATGKKFAVGTGNAQGSYVFYYNMASGSTLAAYPLTVTGLDFKPSLVVIGRTANASGYMHSTIFYPEDMFGGYRAEYFGDVNRKFELEPGKTEVTQGGFVLPCYRPETMKYWAFE